MSRPLGVEAGSPALLRVGYEHADPEALLARDDVLAVIGFGAAPERHADPRRIDVALPPLGGAAPLEVWRGAGRVALERAGGIDYAHDGALAVVRLELREAEHGGIRAAARDAYARLGAFLRATPYRHPLRIWNYFDAITAGEGDEERYRLFCVGRAEGLGEVPRQFAAATAIGCPRVADADSRLQVYALCARAPGQAVENPRQVSAYRYPRRYGPQPPSFARAMRAPGLPLMLSGTASVVGHASVHPGDVAAQTREILVNLERLLQAAGAQDPARAPGPGGGSLKVYVRHPGDAATVEPLLRARFPGTPLLLLAGDVCRAELLLEIDGFHG